MDKPKLHYDTLIDWLLKGDVAIQFQVYRDLLNEIRPELQSRIASEGWGGSFLAARKPNGHWGIDFYQPKWISSHYTLLDLRNLCIAPDLPEIHQTIQLILKERKNEDGGVNPAREIKQSDVCVNGMFLNYASYFQTAESELKSIIDFLIREQMPDGGFNCRSNRSGARHSSMHSTVSVLEGLLEYERNDYHYRLEEVREVRKEATEFLLKHHLFKSDRTGEIIHNDFLKLSYPARWKYDILRALDYFQDSGTAWDNRMQDAVDVLLKKRNKDGSWNVQAKHPGQVHFEMEKAGKPSRWNTLRAMRVLNRLKP